MPWTEEDEDQKAKLLATWEKETLAPKLEKLEAEINAAGGPFFLGKDVSILDFVILPICEFMKGKWNLDLAQFCTLTKLREAVAARPNIAAWIKKRPESTI
uniref:Glutathione S-transferase 1 n=1 Tax=Phallusia mammillata TaxID=59560 RepID=A0A6F9DLF4_9ASCI|nr:glutathione S-transferase 1 [Phallusia mammillata]